MCASKAGHDFDTNFYHTTYLVGPDFCFLCDFLKEQENVRNLVSYPVMLFVKKSL